MVYSGVLGSFLLVGSVLYFTGHTPNKPDYSAGDIVILIATVLHLSLFSLIVHSNLKNPSYVWAGPGPPTAKDLAPGMTVDDLEAHRLLSKYGEDPWSPHEDFHERSVALSEREVTFSFGPGGQWLIEPRLDNLAVSTDPVSAEDPVSVHDLGSSYAVDVFATEEDLRGVTIRAGFDTVNFIIPPGNEWWSHLAGDTDEVGNRVATVLLEHDVVPVRAWADLWEGVLRVNLPMEFDDFFDGVDSRDLEPIVRDGPPPQLPVVPGYAKRPPSIDNLHYADHGDIFEVAVTVLPHMVRSFRYEVLPEVLTLFFEEAKRKTSDKGLRVRVKQHKLVLRLPVRVLQGSANHQLEGNTFRVWLHKA